MWTLICAGAACWWALKPKRNRSIRKGMSPRFDLYSGASRNGKTCPPGCVPVPNKDGTYMWCACTDSNGDLVYRPLDPSYASGCPEGQQDCGSIGGEKICCEDCDAPLCGLGLQATPGRGPRARVSDTSGYRLQYGSSSRTARAGHTNYGFGTTGVQRPYTSALTRRFSR